MVKAVCGESRPETGSRFARDTHGLEGGKIPNKESTYPYRMDGWKKELPISFLYSNGKVCKKVSETCPNHDRILGS